MKRFWHEDQVIDYIQKRQRQSQVQNPSQAKTSSRVLETTNTSIRSLHEVPLGIGDDAAILDNFGVDRRSVVASDMLVEGVHFAQDQPHFSWQAVGHKALAVNLSDIAAMGARPVAAFINLALPKDWPAEQVFSLCDGFLLLAKEHGLEVAGGDTVMSPKGACISITVHGRPLVNPKDGQPCPLVLRSGARAGDQIWVTGKLGGSLDGKHLHVTPRVSQGQFIARRGLATAMLDLSDGLASDLARLARASGLYAQIWADKIPLSDHLDGPQEQRLKAGLNDGEDFELCFTTPEHSSTDWLSDWRRLFPDCPVRSVGHMLKTTPVVLSPHQSAPELLIKPALKPAIEHEPEPKSVSRVWICERKGAAPQPLTQGGFRHGTFAEKI